MFDSKRFLADYFHNPEGVVSFLNAYRAPRPEKGTVIQWFRRDSVPGSWFAVLLAYLELDRGAPVSLHPYLTRL